MPFLDLTKGETREWNGQKIKLKPISDCSRSEDIIQHFVIQRVARFTPTQSDWLVHWLRTTAVTVKNASLTRESIMAIVQCIEGSP